MEARKGSGGEGGKEEVAGVAKRLPVLRRSKYCVAGHDKHLQGMTVDVVRIVSDINSSVKHINNNECNDS